jgi:hypothetical protein
MLTGALASSYYGRPRTTIDLDVIVDTNENELTGLAEVLTSTGLRAQLQKLEATWRSDYRIITIEDTKSPHLLDLIFTDQKLERKAARILGLPTYCQTAESLILAKLRMIKATVQVERAAIDRNDIRAIFETTHINLRRLRSKAKKESTAKILEALLKGVGMFGTMQRTSPKDLRDHRDRI